MQVYTSTFNKDILMKCSNCNIDLLSEDEYKVHYKSQYHRYNIKRKMLGLKPATQEQFMNKKGAQTIIEEVKDGKQFQCKSCRKTFTNDGVYKQHLQSKKHQQIAKQQKVLPDKKEKKIVKRQIVAQLCLFCDAKFDNYDKNLVHMERSHGFFVSQKQFCKNVSGLIKYFHEKIEVGLLCIFCENKGFKQFQSGEAIRSHMKDKSHCFMNTTNGFQQFEKFYDFGKLFDQRVEDQKNYRFLVGLQSDVVEVQIPQQNKQIRKKETVKPNQTIDIENKTNQNDDQWEDDEDCQEQQWSDISDEQDEQINQMKQVKQKKQKPKTKKYVMYKPTVMESGQLLLPNGKLLGTRKYRHLYKQYYRPLAAQQKRLLMLGNQVSSALVLRSERIQLFKQMNKQSKVSKTFQNNRDLKLRLRQNKLQYHFRCQTPL